MDTVPSRKYRHLSEVHYFRTKTMPELGEVKQLTIEYKEGRKVVAEKWHDWSSLTEVLLSAKPYLLVSSDVLDVLSVAHARFFGFRFRLPEPRVIPLIEATAKKSALLFEAPDYRW